MNFAALNDQWHIVCLAYVAAFMPWTAFHAKDFISEEWKSLRDTRFAGYVNLTCSIVPALYIIVYCSAQFAANDWKEGSATVVALAFAILHAARSAWGLWQLHLFRTWCAQSIDALAAMGVSFRFSDKERCHLLNDCSTSWDMADEILVNNSIAENQLFHGDIKSYVQYGESIHVLAPKFPRRLTPYKAVTLVWDYIAFCLKALFCIGVMLLDGIRFVLRTETSGRLRHILKEPIDVWINWAIAFAAQALRSWMSHFNISVNPRALETSDNVGEAGLEEWQRRASYFASEVLSPSIMQLWPEIQSGKHPQIEPMLWNGFKEGPEMHSGRLVRRELLENAMSSGDGLPLGVKHELKDEDSSRPEQGYKAFSRQIAYKIARMDVRKEFCSEIGILDLNMLEWLTILLYMGIRSIDARKLDWEKLVSERETRGDTTNGEDLNGEKEDNCGGDSVGGVPPPRDTPGMIFSHIWLEIKGAQLPRYAPISGTTTALARSARRLLTIVATAAPKHRHYLVSSEAPAPRAPMMIWRATV